MCTERRFETTVEQQILEETLKERSDAEVEEGTVVAGCGVTRLMAAGSGARSPEVEGENARSSKRYGREMVGCLFGSL